MDCGPRLSELYKLYKLYELHELHELERSPSLNRVGRPPTIHRR